MKRKHGGRPQGQDQVSASGSRVGGARIVIAEIKPGRQLPQASPCKVPELRLWLPRAIEPRGPSARSRDRACVG